MHYATLKNGHLAVVIDDQLIDLVEAAKQLDEPLHLTGLYDLIEAEDEVQQGIAKLTKQALTENIARQGYASHVLQSPLGRLRRNVFCIGKNYADHAAEIAAKLDNEVELPQHPIVFTKATNTLIGPHDEIPLHAEVTRKIDYEGELAVVIAKRGCNIAAETAWQHVFGYTCYNDVSARDLQRRHVQWHLGKSLDGFGPMGPVITPTYGKPLSGDIGLRCSVNGEIRQAAVLAQMIFDIPTIIATLSKGITLEPGDVIATGTPAGVGMGFTPSKFLQPGDQVEVAIDGTLPLINSVALT